MRLDVEDKTLYELEVDPDKLIEEFGDEWQDFIGDDPVNDAAKREFVTESLHIMGMEDFTLPGESPWCIRVKKDHDLDVTVRRG